MLTVLRRLFRRIDAVVLCCTLGLSAFSVVLLLGIQQMGVIGRRQHPGRPYDESF